VVLYLVSVKHKKIGKKWSISDVFYVFFILLQNWWFLPPGDLKPPYDDVTVPVVFWRCHGFPDVAGVPGVVGVHLVASFLALTAIPAVDDDQCHAVAGFPVVAEVPYLAEFAAVAGVPDVAGFPTVAG
jgi:hypothetical protein